MKKFILSSIVMCFCCVMFCCVDYLYADFDTYTKTDTTKIEFLEQGASADIFRIKYQNNALYILDSTNKKVYAVTEEGVSTVYADTHSPFDIANINDNYLVSTQTMFMDYIDKEGAYTEINRYTNESNTPAALLSPQTIATSANLDTYLIKDSEIIKFDQVNKSFEWFANLTFDANELTFGNGFCVTEDNKNIIFSTTDNKIYSLDTESKQILQLATTLTFTEIRYLNVDNLGNLYVLDGDTLKKVQEELLASFTFDVSPISIDIDFVSGKLYYATSSEVFCTRLSAGDKNFVTSYSDIVAPLALTDITADTTMFSAVSTTKETTLYTYQTLLVKNGTYQSNKTLILLDDSHPNFYYVYDNNFDNEQGYFVGYVLKSDCTAITSSTPAEFSEINTAKVITGFSDIFSMPISQPFGDNKFVPILGTLKYGDMVTVLDTPLLQKDKNGVSFVAIEYLKDSTIYIGYIDSSTIVRSTAEVPEVKSVPNAQTKAETIVYKEKNCLTKIDILAKGQKVKIVSSLNDVSKIEYYVYEGNEEIIMTGFVKSNFLDNGTLTTSQIIGIVLIGVSVILAIVVTIIYIKKRKNQLNQDEEL